MRVLTLFYGLLLSSQCLAAGIVTIDGRTADGWRVVFDPETESVATWKERREGKDSSYQEFEGYCKNTEAGFECVTQDKSPLSGTKYERRYAGSCDVENEYVCVEGCGKNRRAPQSMTQGYWEGDPDCGKTEDEIHQSQMVAIEERDCWEHLGDFNRRNLYRDGWITGGKVNLREQPDITGRILKELPEDAVVRVVSSTQMCIVVGGRGGRWVKIEVNEGAEIVTGYVFDAHILYKTQN